VKTHPNTATPKSKRKREKWGSSKKPLHTPPTKRASVVGMYISGAKQRAIARELGIDRETVTRILSQEETKLLVRGFRDAVLRIVPQALIGAHELVKRLHPQTIANVLYGARVLIDRHEVEPAEPPKRTYASAKMAFYGRYGRWPSEEEAIKFDKTIKRTPMMKAELTG
jgi:transposase-like protein